MHINQVSAGIKFACSTNFSRPLLHVVVTLLLKNNKLRLLKFPNLTQTSLKATPKTLANSEQLDMGGSSSNCLSNIVYATVFLNKVSLFRNSLE